MGVKAELRGMTKGVYDPNNDGVIDAAQTEADMKKAVYDPDTDNEIAGAQIHDDLTHANLTNVTRKKWLGAPHRHSGGGEQFGIALDPDVDESIDYSFCVDDLFGFCLLTNIKVYYTADTAGNAVVLNISAYYAAAMEAQHTHNENDFTNIITITGALRQIFLTSLSLGSLAAGDLVFINVYRDADHASDTNTGDLVINGVLVEYLANM